MSDSLFELSSLSEVLPLSQLLLVLLLHFVWQATLIVALVAIGRSLVHPRCFRARYALSVAGLFAVLLGPILTAGYYLSSEEAMLTLRSPSVATEALSRGVTLAPSDSFTSLLETQFQAVFNWFDKHRLFWLGGWLVGFAILLARLCLSLEHCIRLRRRQQPLPPHLQAIAAGIQRKLNLPRNVIVASSQEITQAVATGIIKPVVFIPVSWITQLPTESIEAVLAHELAHLKRWDLWINLLQRFAETVFFFHPLVWWLSRQITSEREVCCDHLAIKVTGRPIEYVETLAQVADPTSFLSNKKPELQFGTAFFGGKNMKLLRRAKMILEPASLDAQSPFRTLSLIACTGLLISYGSYAYCATPTAALALIQDHDHEDHNDHTHDHEDRAIVVRGKRLQTDEGERVELVFVDDEEQDQHNSRTAKLHGHLVELLHGQNSKQIDHRELARQLRRLADQLESEDKPHMPHAARQKRVEVRRRNVRKGDLELERIESDKNNRLIDVEVDSSENVFLHESDRPEKMIVELKKDNQDTVYVPGKQNMLIELRRQVDKPKVEGVYTWRAAGGVEVPHKTHDENEVREMQFGDATTSQGELGQVLRDLRNEVQQLRREVNQLRSNRNSTDDRPVRYRVQERKMDPDRTIEVEQVRGAWELRDPRAKRTDARNSREKSKKTRIKGLNASDDVQFGESGNPQATIWVEKKSGDDSGKGKGSWMVFGEEATKTPDRKFRVKPSIENLPPDSALRWKFDLEVEEDDDQDHDDREEEEEEEEEEVLKGKRSKNGKKQS